MVRLLAIEFAFRERLCLLDMPFLFGWRVIDIQREG